MCKEALRCRALCGWLRRRCPPPLFCVSFLNKLVSPNQQHNFSLRFIRGSGCADAQPQSPTELIWCAIFPFIIFIFLRCNLFATSHRCRRTRIQFSFSVVVVVQYSHSIVWNLVGSQPQIIIIARRVARLLFRFQPQRKCRELKASVSAIICKLFLYSSVLTAFCYVRPDTRCIARFTCQRELLIRKTTEKMHSKLHSPQFKWDKSFVNWILATHQLNYLSNQSASKCKIPIHLYAATSVSFHVGYVRFKTVRNELFQMFFSNSIMEQYALVRLTMSNQQ